MKEEVLLAQINQADFMLWLDKYGWTGRAAWLHPADLTFTNTDGNTVKPLKRTTLNDDATTKLRQAKLSYFLSQDFSELEPENQAILLDRIGLCEETEKELFIRRPELKDLF